VKMVSKGLKRTRVCSMCNASSSLPVFPPDARVFLVLIWRTCCVTVSQGDRASI
jgi:hypothetical protein